MKIIQICGTNGTGKTTLMKNLLRSGKFLKMSVDVDGKSREWWFDGKVAVIGKYNSANCCGVDAGNWTGEALIKAIDTLIAKYGPKALLFEDVRFGGSYDFKKRVKQIAEKAGYEYSLFALTARFETLAARVLNRTGNSNANYDAMRSKARQVIISSRKIQQDGARVVFVDTGDVGPEQALNILVGEING